MFRIGRRFCSQVIGFLLLNAAIFAAYRIVFISLFGAPGAFSAVPAVLLRGVRLDAALLAPEVCLLVLIALMTRSLRLRSTLAGLWVFTWVNFLCAVVNLFVFHERRRHLWEIVQDRIGQPREMLAAVQFFASAHPFVTGASLLSLALIVLAARLHTRPLAGQAVDLWRPAAGATTLVIVGACVLATIEVAPTKETKALQLRLLSSLDRMRFGDYVVNQAVGNPLQDLIRLFDLGGSATSYRLGAQEALDLSRRLLGIAAADPAYPLLRAVRGQEPLGVRNVVVIIVEGLSSTLVDQRAGGEYVMPYIHGLCEQGLCFRKIMQSFFATDGSVFAAVTSLPPPFALSRSRELPAQAINAFDGSLARSLGAAGYRHYYVAGFRQRSGDFVTFMGNQGYRGLGYEELRARLGASAPADSNALGIFDGPMLQEAAGIILSAPGPFTAHLVTATTHSPWTVPPSMTNRIAIDVLASFQYLDRSVRDFVETLRLRDPDFDRTLVVITGDHTSHVWDARAMERFRIPLILFGPRLARAKDRWAALQEQPGTHLDIVPTVLGLFDGEHLYSGMGRNLLDPDLGASGLISGTKGSFLYVKGGFALRYAPSSDESELFVTREGDVLSRDVTNEQPDVAARLRRELLALSETAHRLGRDRRIFPLPGAKALPDGHR